VQSLNGLPGITGHAVGIVADASKTVAIEHLITRMGKESDKLDVIVANAGASWSEPFDTFEDTKVCAILDINVRGIFNLVRL
jgi:NAD(P)-dependent dehydrogenase (short-subunit alcohol dehydrogenase family)